MKANRSATFKKMDDSGSIGTYVLIMFGIIVTLYMFGYTSTLDLYLQDNENKTDPSSTINITDPKLQQNENTNPMYLFLKALMRMVEENPWAVGVGIGVAILGMIIGTLTGTLSTILTYVIPILLIGVVLNLFIFPLTSIDTELANFMIWEIPLSWIIIMFLNLMYILAILEYVRTGTTT